MAGGRGHLHNWAKKIQTRSNLAREDQLKGRDGNEQRTGEGAGPISRSLGHLPLVVSEWWAPLVDKGKREPLENAKESERVTRGNKCIIRWGLASPLDMPRGFH